jgi:hypothetical protein
MAQFCRSCGSTLDEGAQFCRVCGATAVQAAQAQYTAPAPQSLAPQSQAPQSPAPQAYAPPYAAPYAQTAPAPAPQQAYYGNGVQPVAWPPVGVGEYIGMMFLTAIPLVGLILLISWAFGSQTNPSKRNYARAILILMVIGIVFSVLLSATLLPLIYDMIDSMTGYI